MDTDWFFANLSADGSKEEDQSKVQVAAKPVVLEYTLSQPVECTPSQLYKFCHLQAGKRPFHSLAERGP